MIMKKTKRLILFLSVVLMGFSFSNCGSSKHSNKNFVFEKNPPFKIDEAFYQKWAAGIEEGGSGINIHIRFSAIDPNVVVQNIYFRDHILEAKNSLQSPDDYVAHLSNNSQKRSVIMDSDQMKEAQNTPTNEFPFQLDENEAGNSYWFQD